MDRDVKLARTRCLVELTSATLARDREKLNAVMKMEQEERELLAQRDQELRVVRQSSDRVHELVRQEESEIEELRQQLAAGKEQLASGKEYVDLLKAKHEQERADHAKRMGELEAEVSRLREQLDSGKVYVDLLKAKLAHAEAAPHSAVEEGGGSGGDGDGGKGPLEGGGRGDGDLDAELRAPGRLVSTEAAPHSAKEDDDHDDVDTAAAGDSNTSAAELAAALATMRTERDAALEQLNGLRKELAAKDEAVVQVLVIPQPSHASHGHLTCCLTPLSNSLLMVQVQREAQEEVEAARESEREKAALTLEKKLKAAERKACVVM